MRLDRELGVEAARSGGGWRGRWRRAEGWSASLVAAWG